MPVTISCMLGLSLQTTNQSWGPDTLPTSTLSQGKAQREISSNSSEGLIQTEPALPFLFKFPSTDSFFEDLFNYLAALGLCCWVRAFSSCAEWRLLLLHGLPSVVASLVSTWRKRGHTQEHPSYSGQVPWPWHPNHLPANPSQIQAQYAVRILCREKLYQHKVVFSCLWLILCVNLSGPQGTQIPGQTLFWVFGERSFCMRLTFKSLCKADCSP